MAQSQADFVIVDLEGITSRFNVSVTKNSDLVIIPMGDEQQDAEAAIDTLAQLAMEPRMMRRKIPVRILFNRTKKISKKTKLATSINKHIRTRVGSFTTTSRVDKTEPITMAVP